MEVSFVLVTCTYIVSTGHCVETVTYGLRVHLRVDHVITISQYAIHLENKISMFCLVHMESAY